jgi:MFS family permease
MKTRDIIAILVAGIASALFVLSAARLGPGGMPLLLLGAFPIYVAALCYGTAAGVGSSIVAILVAGIVGSTQSAIVIGFAFTIPASIIGHQVNLAQQDADGNLEWFPLPQLFFNLCAMLSIGIIALGFLVGYDEALLSNQMKAAVEEILRQNPDAQTMTPAELDGFANGIIRIMPFVFSGVWLVVHVANLYLSGIVARSLSLMPRPRDDIPATANLPRIALFILIASIVLASFASGQVQLVSGVVAGIFIMAFALLGLANLHLKSRQNPGGLLLVIIAYALIAILYLPIYLFAVTGIFRNINGIPAYPPSKNGQ